MDEKIMILGRVLYTMDQITVHGKDNLNKMLGCIQGLESLKELLEQEKAKAQAAPEVNADGNGN